MSVELTSIGQNAYSASSRLFSDAGKPSVVREADAGRRNGDSEAASKPVIFGDKLSGENKAELNIIQREVPTPDSQQASNAYEIVARKVPDYSAADEAQTLPREGREDMPGMVKGDDGEVRAAHAEAARELTEKADQQREDAAESRAEDERRVREILDNRDRFA